MKHFTLLLVSLAITLTSFSQIRLEKTEVTVKMGYTEYERGVYVKVYNDANNTAEVDMRRELVKEVFGSINYFCWGVNCYPANANQSNPEASVIIDPQGVDETFTAYYNPEERPGVTEIDYIFTNANDTSDNQRLTIIFDATEATVGIKELAKNQVKVAYSAANEQLTLALSNLEGAGSIEIRDITGKVVFMDDVRLDDGVLIVPTQRFTKGIHLVNLLNENGEVLNISKVSIF
ncbi:T9SS type A sorting domain-containing protein [Luteibaculum oceani]|uniref:T9SS type A sorting domain-containing protein n=1 Tax=Luteibaculum oceani TaxID=1294296 RepID=A0A5C6VI19_9FLAO|nr:hypothetical protein [Luteibaculum oceani]TXC85062.1 hypothetical protein FRX97_00115 [Luteibaculum oceani]